MVWRKKTFNETWFSFMEFLCLCFKKRCLKGRESAWNWSESYAPLMRSRKMGSSWRRLRSKWRWPCNGNEIYMNTRFGCKHNVSDSSVDFLILCCALCLLHNNMLYKLRVKSPPASWWIFGHVREEWIWNKSQCRTKSSFQCSCTCSS